MFTIEHVEIERKSTGYICGRVELQVLERSTCILWVLRDHGSTVELDIYSGGPDCPAWLLKHYFDDLKDAIVEVVTTRI